MANCSPCCASTCPLPTEFQTAMSQAQRYAPFTLNTGTHQPWNIEKFCLAIKSALDSDSIISIDFDDIRSLLGQGHLSLGYGHNIPREGAVIKACKASVQGRLIENPDLLRTATGILVIIRTPKHANIKLSEVRDGLREIWQHSSDAVQRIYTCIDADNLTDTVEVYTLVVNQKTFDPQLGIIQNLTLDDALQKLSRLVEQTDSDLILLQSACQLLAKHQKSSTGFIQRKLKIGYAKASNLLKKLEHAEIVESISSEGLRPVLVRF